MKTLINRILSPTPGWFQKIIKLALTLAALGGGILAGASQIPGYHLPDFIEKICQAFVIGGVAAAAVAKTAKEDNPATEVTSPKDSSAGTSSLPVSVFIVAALSLLLSGCSRKVALNKSDTSIAQATQLSQTAATDSTGSRVTNETKQKDSTGTVDKNAINVSDSQHTKELEVSATLAGGKGIISGRVNNDGTFSIDPGNYSIAALDIKDIESGFNKDSSASQEKDTADVQNKSSDITKDTGSVSHKTALQSATQLTEKVSTKIKQVTSEGLTVGKVIILLIILAALYTAWHFLGPYIEVLFGRFIALFKKGEDKA